MRPIGPVSPIPVPRSYLASIHKLSEWLLNSGAYMHWMAAKPV